jgi:3-(3-hydroxy-phenyl)propionate hydroxylase
VVLSDDALGLGLAMVGFGVDPTEALTPAQAQAWRARGGQFVQINPRGHMARPSSLSLWEDIAGGLIPAAVPVGWVAVVRPDKVVMHDGPSAQASAMLSACSALLVAQPLA